MTSGTRSSASCQKISFVRPELAGISYPLPSRIMACNSGAAIAILVRQVETLYDDLDKETDERCECFKFDSLQRPELIKCLCPELSIERLDYAEKLQRRASAKLRHRSVELTGKEMHSRSFILSRKSLSSSYSALSSTVVRR